MEKRLGVIPGDGHCRLMHLPFDLGTKRLPKKFQDEGPGGVGGPDGTRQWIVEGRPWSGVGWAGVGRGAVSCYARAGRAEEPEPGIFRAAHARYRCEGMDRAGGDAELVNGPNRQIGPIQAPALWGAVVRWVAPVRGGGCRRGSAESVPDAGRQLPHGADGGTNERRRVRWHLRSPSRTALRPRRGGRRLGAFSVLALRP